jgi:hypothetical protein
MGFSLYSVEDPEHSRRERSRRDPRAFEHAPGSMNTWREPEKYLIEPIPLFRGSPYKRSKPLRKEYLKKWLQK